jgi:hypothetical protein
MKKKYIEQKKKKPAYKWAGLSRTLDVQPDVSRPGPPSSPLWELTSHVLLAVASFSSKKKQ